ncbi:DUF1801 domain-containing protein [Aurantibacter sp.]|uniref:DUF1801 domain-containing protein n=1 Tax=Aurantibacter sp. TaxID=2807103 RepID=UPI0035C87A7B
MNPAEAYILKQEEPFKSVLLDLKSIVEAVIPDIELHYKWKIPFFMIGKKPICYLNQSKGYVDLCFWHSEIMEQYSELFVKEKRKVVASLRYKSRRDINDVVLIYVLEMLKNYEGD